MPISALRAVAASPIDTSCQYGGKDCDEEAPTMREVALSYGKEAAGTRNLYLKPAAYLAKAIDIHSGDATAHAVAGAFGQAKNLTYGGEIVERVYKILGAGGTFRRNPDCSNLGALTNEICLETMPVIDFMKAVTDIVRPLSAAARKTADGIYSVVGVFSATYGTAEELQKIGEARANCEAATTSLRDRAEDARDAKVTQSWLKIGIYANYFVLGVLGIGAYVEAITVAPWIILALSTNALVFTLVGHFQKKLAVEPAQARVDAVSAKAAV